MGKIIVLEGLDGCGKGTQFELLKGRLLEDKYKLKLLDFPQYEDDSSIFVRRYLGGVYGNDPNDINPYQASLCYAMDRFDAFVQDKEIKEAIREEDRILLANRYTTSNMLFQATKMEDDEKTIEFLNWLEDIEYEKLGILRPDLVLFLYMPVEYSLKLMKGRDVNKNASKNNMKTDIHENNEDYLRMVAERSLLVAEKQGFKIINCVKDNDIRTINDIHEEVYSLVKKMRN